MRDAAEFGKIGRYYAAESMLVMDQETGEYKVGRCELNVFNTCCSSVV